MARTQGLQFYFVGKNDFKLPLGRVVGTNNIYTSAFSIIFVHACRTRLYKCIELTARAVSTNRRNLISYNIVFGSPLLCTFY